MPSFLDEALEESRGRTPCKVRDIVDRLDEETRESYEESLKDPRIKATHIAAVFQKRKFRVSERTVQRHVAKKCSCYVSMTKSRAVTDEDEEV